LKNLYDKIEEYIPQILFLFILLLMAVQVFTRYILNFTLPWNIELCRYSFVWLTFTGAAYVRKENAHIKIEVLFNYLYKKCAPRIQKIIWLSKELLTIVYLIVLIIFGVILAYNSRRFLSQAMQISQFYLYISVSIGMIFYLIREIQYAIKYYKKEYLNKKSLIKGHIKRGLK